MANQTKSAGAVVEGNIYGAGSMHWTSIGNLITSDNAYATAVKLLPGTWYPYTPILTDFGFTIPAGSTINKISVLIEAKTLLDAGTTRIDYVSLVSGGVPVFMHAYGSQTADVAPDPPLTTSDVVYTFNPVSSGDGDLWGQAWTPTLINAANFGCAFDCFIEDIFDTVAADHVRISVDYTEEPAPGPVCDNRPCGKGYESMEMAIKAMIGKLNVPRHPYDGCVGLKLALELKDCATLTELKDCGTNYTLEQAFKAALRNDGCDGATLRVFIVPAGGRGEQV